MAQITGVTKENFSIGIEVNENFFQGVMLEEVLAELQDVRTAARFIQYALGKDARIKEALMKVENTLNVLKFIEEKKKDCSTSDAVEITRYSQSHAADSKRRLTT